LQQAIESLVSDLTARHAAVKTLDERLAVLIETMDCLPPLFFSRLVPAVACGQVPLQMLLRLCADLPDGERTVLELTRGLPYNVTTEMDLALWAAASAIRGDQSAAQHFIQTDAATLSAEFLDGSLPPTAQAVLTDFLQRYGMRGVGEIDIGRQRWGEDPTSLFQALNSYLKIENEALSPEIMFRQGKACAKAAQVRLLAMLKERPGGWGKARLAKVMAGRVRQLTGLRESPKFAAIRAMTAHRQGLMISGRELVSAGLLQRPDDIFFLRLGDLKALAGGEQRDWKTIVTGRRQAYQREKRRRMLPRVLLSDGTAFYEGMGATGEGNADVITGSPVSPGVVEGPVHVVLDPYGAKLIPGEILVCPGTDPAWTPLFLAAGGLVMEVGGMMTHGSVVAREYGIPAVVGVDQATSRLKSGQRIRLDGSKGMITICRESE
jgi:pyruvate,water dikinase